MIKEFITLIKIYFDIKDLGFIKDYLGIKVNYDIKNKRIKLYQNKYINKIFNKFKFDNINFIKSSIDFITKFKSNSNQTNKKNIKLFQ
jgi:hypothetical protein